ncbi:MAG: hypothetical protein ACK5P6_06510 [Pseudobdellovibrionaceae bacterium]|jgi:hypothetical protein
MKRSFIAPFSKFLPLMALVAFSFYHSETRHYDVRLITQPLLIQANKFDPARIAFEEIAARQVQSDQVTSQQITPPQKKAEVVLNLNETAVQKAANGFKSFKAEHMILPVTQVTKESIAQFQEDWSWVNELPPAQKRRIEIAKREFNIEQEDWKIPTTQELIKAKIREVIGEDIDQEKRQDNESSKLATDLRFQGEIQFDRLPWYPELSVQAHWYEDNVAKRPVKIDMSQHRYTATLDRPIGSLRARLVDPQGLILGEGIARISQTDIAAGRGPTLILRPSLATMAGNLDDFKDRKDQSFSSSKGEKKISSPARVLFASYGEESAADQFGRFQFDRVAPGSWGIVRTESSDFYPSLYLTQAGTESQWPQFSKSMVQALLDIASERSLVSLSEENNSIVFGQIKQDGKPISGLKVGAELFPEQMAIYFNELMLPDFALEGTSSNGYFAILNLPEGFHSLIVKAGEHYFSHQNVIVDANTISFTEVESTLRKDRASLKIFDAFSSEPQEVEIEGQSWSESFQATGESQVYLPQVNRLSLMKVKPFNQQYADAIYQYNDLTDFIHVPLLQTRWLADLAATRRLSLNPNSGTVVGFVQGDQFEVYLPHLQNFDPQNILYFDSQGRITTDGQQGGGFIVYNLPESSQSIVVLGKEANLLNSKVIPVDLPSLNVLNFSF